MDIFQNSIHLSLFDSLTTSSISGISHSAYSVHSPMPYRLLLIVKLLYFSHLIGISPQCEKRSPGGVSNPSR